jgi:prophage DNA circulation protein
MPTIPEPTTVSQTVPTAPFMPALTKEQEMQMLEQQMKFLQSQLDTIRKRIEELSG